MYRALYRKWRPQVFADVVGQQDITSALQNQITHNKIGHAFMFTGTRGTGKTTCAKIFAKAVNCLAPNNGDPCGECEICKGLDNGSILDVIEIDAASNNGVDNIRDLRDETAYTPASCTYKVYIIDEVHMLSNQAFNALLKIMEEPPSHVIFILATTEIHKVPATILSRCQRYDFKRISQNDIAKRLEYIVLQENIKLTQPAAQLISRLADGAMRDALSILETCTGGDDEVDEDTVRRVAGVCDKSYLFTLSDAISKKDIAAALQAIAETNAKSIDIKRICEELINHYRNIMLCGISAEGLLSGISSDEQQAYVNAAKEISQSAAIGAIKALGSGLERMGKGTDSRIELELALFSLCFDQPVKTAPPVQAQPVPAVARGFVPPPQITPQPAESAPVPPPPPPVKKAEASAPQQPLIPMEPFSQWQEVVAQLEKRDPLAYANLKDKSTAYYDGRRVLIDAGELFLEFIRKNDASKDIIKEAIFAVTGNRCAIGPYIKEKTQNAAPTIDAELKQLEQQGVDVQIID